MHESFINEDLLMKVKFREDLVEKVALGTTGCSFLVSSIILLVLFKVH